MAHPWLVPPAEFNPEGFAWALKSQKGADGSLVVALYECTTSEPAGVELSEWEVPRGPTESGARDWLTNYMPDADATSMARAMVSALSQS